jgi:UDP-N-acetylglucosamine 2-epimerase
MMAEEINRRVVDCISSLLCAPSQGAFSRLRSEQPAGRIVLTGDIARDVLIGNVERSNDVTSIPSWPIARDEPFAFVTLHRAELTDVPNLLSDVVATLAHLPVHAVMATHPRTRAVLVENGFSEKVLGGRLHLLPPLSYLDTLAAIRGASAVVTDSGGVQREAYWLGRPCITLRKETEWPETVACGANVLLSPEHAASSLSQLVARVLAKTEPSWNRDAYGKGNAAELIADAIAKLEHDLIC